MKLIEERDRQCAVGLSMLHNAVLWQTAAIGAAQRGGDELASMIRTYAEKVATLTDDATRPLS